MKINKQGYEYENKDEAKDGNEQTETDSLISPDMELAAEIQSQEELAQRTLRTMPVREKVDIHADDIYSDYYNVELQIKLKKCYENLKSPMRRVGDYLDANHNTLKDKNIYYMAIAEMLGLTEGQVYSAVQKLQAYDEYSFAFHAIRKKRTAIEKFGAFRFSIDDYTGWSKENDIREKIITRKIIVVKKSLEIMTPKFKERIAAHKRDKILEIKNKVNRQKQKIVQKQMAKSHRKE